MNIDRLKPVFIMGCPRSGTTMIASQLGVHRDVVVLPELPFLSMILLAARKGLAGEEVYRRLLRHPKFATIGIRLERDVFVREWREGGWKAALSMIFDRYFQSNGVTLDPEQSLVWVEHYPSNVHYFYLYLEFFQEAKFIHIYRDPRAVYSSMKPLARWPVGEPIRLVGTWLHYVSKAFVLRDHRPDIVMEVKYEDYVQGDDQLRRICDFVGVEFEEAMLDGGGIILPEFTRGQHQLTMSRSDPRQAEAWRKKIDPREAEVITALCFEWMVYCGYASEQEQFAGPSSREKLVWFIKRVQRHFSARLRKRLGT